MHVRSVLFTLLLLHRLLATGTVFGAKGLSLRGLGKEFSLSHGKVIAYKVKKMPSDSLSHEVF